MCPTNYGSDVYLYGSFHLYCHSDFTMQLRLSAFSLNLVLTISPAAPFLSKRGGPASYACDSVHLHAVSLCGFVWRQIKWKLSQLGEPVSFKEHSKVGYRNKGGGVIGERERGQDFIEKTRDRKSIRQFNINLSLVLCITLDLIKY